MKKLLIFVLALGSLSSFASDCSVANYDQYQDRPLSKQVKRILKKKGYAIIEADKNSNFIAGELCASTGEDDYCSLVVFSKTDGSLVTSGNHREGRTLLSLYREALRGKNYSKIKSCKQLN